MSDKQHADWYYRIMDETVGPVRAAELRELAKQRTITFDTLLRRGEKMDWVPAFKVKGLFGPRNTIKGTQREQSPLPPATLVENALASYGDPPPALAEKSAFRSDTDAPFTDADQVYDKTIDGESTVSKPSVELDSEINLTNCGDCGKEVSKRAAACPHCGAPAISNMSQCKRCKGQIEKDAVVCPHCQLWQDPSQYWGNYIVIWVVMTVFCFLFGAIFSSC